MKIQYMIGTTSCTEEDKNLDFLDKQLQLSIPLVTGVNIKYKENKKEKLAKIYVGKEINLKEYQKEKFLLEKYDISLNDLAEVAVLGYSRACLLNYKKYETVLVGVENDALVVPDYFALKKMITFFENKFLEIIE